MTVREPGEPVEEGFDWAVLDGYRLGAEDEELVAKAARHVLVIDDRGTGGDHGEDLASTRTSAPRPLRTRPKRY